MFAPPSIAYGDWAIATAASLRYDNNVGNAQTYGDKISDTIAAARLSLFEVIPLGENYSLAAGGKVAAEDYDRLTGLRNATFDVALSLKRKWGLGAFAPWARAELSLGRSNYDDGYRDATIYRAGLEFGKRLDERWNWWAQYGFERRTAAAGENVIPGTPSDAFSQVGQSASVNLQYLLTERIFIRVGSLWRRGDIVSSNSHGGYLYLAARAVEEDPTFGPNAYAYKLPGTTYQAGVALEYSLTAHSVIGCGFQHLETHAEGGNDYAKSISDITWSYRF
jgi:hypothetical protein